MDSDLNWPMTERINSLQLQIALMLSNELPIGRLIEQPLEITHEQLLEVVLLKLREESVKFNKKRARHDQAHLDELNDNLNRISNAEEVDHEQLRIVESNIEGIQDDIYKEMLMRRRDFQLIEDERPSAAFLKMETNRGYAEVTRLRIPNKFYNKNIDESANNVKYYVVTEQAAIRKEMANAFQEIYNKQDNLNSSEDGIKEFLDSDGDWAPYQELLNRKIPKAMSDSLEGLLREDELKGLSIPEDEGFFISRNRWVHSQSPKSILE